MATHVVCKPLPSADGLLPSGTQVDASAWKHTRKLIAARFLRPLTPNDTDAPRNRQRGREVPDAKPHH